MAAYLLLDLSNSFAKIAVSAGTLLGPVKRCRTRELSLEAVASAVADRSFDACVYCSVVPERSAVVEAFARSQGKHCIAIGPDTVPGLTIELPKPVTTGADRLVNAAYAAMTGPLPAIVADFGTAATFDVVAPGGSYRGGVIAPGLEVMASYLHDRTSLLPEIELREPVIAVGRTTEEAMLAGAVYGYRGLVREILDRIREEAFPGLLVRVVGTGGYVEMLNDQIPEIVSNLTLEGLQLIAERLFE